MKRSINLASTAVKLNPSYRKIFYGALALFIVSFLSAIGVLGYRLYLQSNLAAFKEQQQAVLGQIVAYKDSKEKYVVVRDRIKNIQTILNKRNAITSRLNTVMDVIPSDAKPANISSEENEVTIRVESDNLSSLNDLVETKIVEIAEKQKKAVKKIELRSFGLNTQELLYSTIFSVEFF